MAWDKVGGGTLKLGGHYVLERHAIHLPATSVAVLPIRLRSYRWRTVMDDGSSTVQGTARSRKEIDASVQAFSTTEASMRSEVVGRRYWGGAPGS
jgi:hypothetical protein